ncbi:neuromodulin-like isoform X1 [Xenopus laevis]|uniref:Neuromodulin-like n=1 Tax=Xenopus laevis TaxID=8355 RepID=A0A8J1LE61_XENLA|nr:neuromodulin-like [Xenopus laevis]XP_041426614.1 neuromodulin-like [Xenopus laevis]XP_041427284.1 neuromodulin-like isoform X1 [Xenopus laevis]
MDKKQRNPSLLTLYSVLKDFRAEYTDFEALASYYEHHYRVEFGENIILKHFLLTCDVDPRMRAKENVMHYWKMLHSLEVIKREYAALRKSAKLPPDHPTRVRNRRKQLEYLRLENTINQHLTHLHHEFLRELKLKKAARKKQVHSPAAEEKEDGAPAAEDEEALDTEDREEEAEGAPAEDPAVEEKMMEEQAPAEEEKEEEAPGAAEEEALASQEKGEGAEDKEEVDGPTNEDTAPPAEEQQVPEEEEKEEGVEVGGSAEEHQAPGMEEKTEEQSPAVEEKEEGADGEEGIMKDSLVVERPTLRKQFRKAIMKRLRRVWHSTQRLAACCCCCCRRPNTMA